MRLEYIIQVLHTKPYLSSHLTGNSCPDNMIGKRDTVYALARSGRKRSIAAREATVRRQSEAIHTNPFRLCPHLIIFPRDDGYPGDDPHRRGSSRHLNVWGSQGFARRNSREIGRDSGSTKDVYLEMRETTEAASPSPSPSVPNGGVMLHRYTLRGGDRYLAASPEKLLEDPVSSVARLPPGYRHLLPAPLRGREEAAERAGRWGWSMKEVYQRMQRQDGGCSIPLPAGPTTGRFSIDTVP